MATLTEVMTIATHSSNSHHLKVMVELHQRSLHQQQTLRAVLLPILMPSMEATRTILPCGMLRLLSSSREGSLLRHLLEPRLSPAYYELAHDAETTSINACFA
jgi:hypothetical protein|tara:strand:- start:5566 stop:5874 length:309 start_codon:yes stop_codon:yes gene_type:complete